MSMRHHEKGKRGHRGHTGPQGEKGDKGDKGDKGENGDKGDKGDKGENGTSCDCIKYPKTDGFYVLIVRNGIPEWNLLKDE